MCSHHITPQMTYFILFLILCLATDAFKGATFRKGIIGGGEAGGCFQGSSTVQVEGLLLGYSVHNGLVCSRNSDHHRPSSLSTSLNAQPFNPFTARHKNFQVKWFEADLERFYAFVETQPLLTARQELWYGKAVKLWIQAEKERETLRLAKGENSTSISNEELAAFIGCTELTLEKM